MTKSIYPPIVGVRLDEAERDMLGAIAVALATERRPHVSLSEVIRAAVRELHGAVRREAGTVACG